MKNIVFYSIFDTRTDGTGHKAIVDHVNYDIFDIKAIVDHVNYDILKITALGYHDNYDIFDIRASKNIVFYSVFDTLEFFAFQICRILQCI